MTYTCTVEGCTDTLIVEIPALGHDMARDRDQGSHLYRDRHR